MSINGYIANKNTLEAFICINAAAQNVKTLNAKEAEAWLKSIKDIGEHATTTLEELNGFFDDAREDGLRAAEGRGLPPESVS